MQIYLPIAEVSVNAFLLLGLGGIVGVLSGMFGVGGGFLMTPLLFFIGIPPAVAVATEANQIVASSFSGVLAHLRRKTVDIKMGTVLLIGGLVGAAIGVQAFAALRAIGQVDLLVKLCYVLFLGIIGSLMFVESLNAIRRSRRATGPVAKRKKHNWIHALPFKMKFRTSGLYISVIPPLIVGLFVGVLAAIMGVGGGFVMVPCDDLFAGDAHKGGCRHLSVPDHLCHWVHHAFTCDNQLYRRYAAGGSAADRGRRRGPDRRTDRGQAEGGTVAHPVGNDGACRLRQTRL
jgi:uncharacterized membrane protein YfcA